MTAPKPKPHDGAPHLVRELEAQLGRLARLEDPANGVPTAVVYREMCAAATPPVNRSTHPQARATALAGGRSLSAEGAPPASGGARPFGEVRPGPSTFDRPYMGGAL